MGFLFLLLFFVAIVILIVNVSKKVQSHEETQRELAAKVANVDTDALMSEVEKSKLRVEVMIQSKAVGDEETYQKLLANTYNGPWPEKRADGGFLSMYDNLRILNIAGINYRQGINRYTGRVMCALVPEPNNEYDPNAIKIVAEDRHHLGYIPSEQTDMVRSITGDTFPYRCEAHIYQAEDEADGHKFFYGSVYIKRKDKGQ